ncbi:hypothetical protein D8Z79_025825 (plasmid) [Escherichia fergusonii]|uniref:Uncharacterized protein n=1 Tax=Lysinibacillus pakistanensis TaxID=759811 RepID=A0ABX6DM45_9BACI|nr:hypothetical protein [Escherichia fergusonii]QCZ35019.1 hypothetical protein D8Z79_025600 [Escherichia fergusonii]QCZ35063.1 hypothetical protein D8Z79_025825 [Escherichia fergusonii]QGG54073.1 hypothetical protein GDS87_24445 [Lysinibacillus pakistanensis]QGG54128.1 hypothetical protein GDS87_24725 [Lysinibacillus pakistanensis]
MNGNVDTDEFIQFVEIAQDTHIQNYLGTDLLEKLQALITAGTIGDPGNEDYNELLTEYVKFMLIHWAMYEYLPFAAYTIANKGVYKHLSENAESVDKNEVDYLQEKHKQIATNYTERCIDYLTFNAGEKFPEYYSNINEDVSPDKITDITDWEI